MHYPVMNEQQLAARWNISTKTLRRWRADKIGPVYRKLGQLVRYFEEDVQEFERCSARHWMTLLVRQLRPGGAHPAPDFPRPAAGRGLCRTGRHPTPITSESTRLRAISCVRATRSCATASSRTL